MARALNELTVRGTAALKVPGRHADGGGLYLRITTAGARPWVFLTVSNGKQAEIGIGPAVSVSLATARRIADEMREAVAVGHREGAGPRERPPHPGKRTRDRAWPPANGDTRRGPAARERHHRHRSRSCDLALRQQPGRVDRPSAAAGFERWQGAARRKAKVAAVALANRNARMIWAMMASGERYREPQVA